MPDLLDALPPASRAAVQRLLADELRSTDEIRLELDAYMGFVQRVERERGGVDIGRALELAARCRTLLDLAEGRPEADRRLAQAASMYLIALEDDLDVERGFEDDAAVVMAVERLLTR